MQPTWHIDRLLLRTDGFASLSAPWGGGEMVTKLLTFQGKSLEINYRTGAAGSVRIEIQDADATPLAGFTAADCPEIIGDEIERVVCWKTAAGTQPADLARLAGKPVRLRFILADADVFSLRFRWGLFDRSTPHAFPTGAATACSPRITRSAPSSHHRP